MELKINREELCSSEVILKTRQEQSVELDYVLPDYYPEIFKIQKCFTSPRIASYSVSGSKLTYELCVNIKIAYHDDKSCAVHVVDQKMMFTKSVELGKTCANPKVIITPSVDYMNCRAVNSRRLDIRGAVSMDICVTDDCKKEVICDAYGMDIELHKKPITYPVNKLYAEKQVTITDDFELGISKPAINDILCFDACVSSTDKKIIANKMVAKGEVCINMFYTCESDKIETLSFTLPFSQIIDIEGIDDRFDCNIDADIMNCEITPRSDGDGNTKVVDCSVSIMVKCHACRMGTLELVCDEYSTSFGTTDQRETIHYDTMPQWINSSFSVGCSFDTGEDKVERVYGVMTNVKNCHFTADAEKNELIADGTICCTLIACTEDGQNIFADKEDNFTYSIPLENASDDCYISVNIVSTSCSYNILSDGTVDAKTELKACGSVWCSKESECITDIFADEENPIQKDENCALKLYFSESGENLWDIAKRYHSSAKLIMDENDIEDEVISNDMMLIIPIM